MLTEWEAAHVDLAEPNETARKELEEKFQNNCVPKDKYTIYSDALEEYQTSLKYDIVIAEGFLHAQKNWRKCLHTLSGLTHENSIVIVTCTDEISVYVEKMKRAVLRFLVKDVEGHKDKIEALKHIMEPQLGSLRGMSRSVEDWIEDQIFMPHAEEYMTIGKAIEYYENDFDVLGASQNIFVDYSWFKDYEYDYLTSYKKQYDEKKHMFLVAGDDNEVYRTAEENMQLEMAVLRANEAARKVEEKALDIAELILMIQNVTHATVNPIVKKFNDEVISIIQRIAENRDINWEEYKVYMGCFGKTMQYLSFIKK